MGNTIRKLVEPASSVSENTNRVEMVREPTK